MGWNHIRFGWSRGVCAGSLPVAFSGYDRDPGVVCAPITLLALQGSFLLVARPAPVAWKLLLGLLRGASAAETAVMTKARTISRFTLPSPGRRDSRSSGPGGQAYIHDKDRQVSRGYLAIWGSVMGRGVYRLGGDRLAGLADQDRPVADVAVEAPPRLVDVVPAGAVWTECGPGGFPAKE